MLLKVAITFLIHGLLAIAASLHALTTKRDPRAAIGWIAVCVLFPLAGPLLYYFFGINRVRTKARVLRQVHGTAPRQEPGAPDLGHLDSSSEDRVPAPFKSVFNISEKVTRRPVVGGNRIEMFEGGEKAYRAMLEAISRARSSVFLSSYIFLKDQTGQRFMHALGEAVRRGVDVKVLLDGVGELYSFYRTGAALKKQGVATARFLPPRLIPPNLSLNLRNHRKILTVDGKVGFAGGMNIGDHHLMNSDNPHRTRDMHFLFEGPLAGQLEQVFLEDWRFATKRGQAPPVSGPADDPWSAVSGRTIVDGPDENLDKLAHVLTGVISAALNRIIIMTPYFLPSREMVSALNSAALKGVEVIIILPEKSNLPYVHWATRNMLWELLIRGVRVFYQPPPFAHTKIFTIDGNYSLVGSANIDPRSLRLNFEIGVEVFDADFAAKVETYCMETAARSLELALEEMGNRPLPARLRDAFFWLFSPYL